MSSLPIFMPFYKTREEQTFRRENAEKVCGVPIFTLKDRLLPFQLIKESNSPIEEIAIRKLHQYTGGIDIKNPENLSKFKCAQTSKGYYVYYNGEPLKFMQYDNNSVPLEIPNGTYYVYIKFADGQEAWGESFGVGPNEDKLLRITIGNDGDIAPIKYADINFKQVVYIDTFLHRSEAEIEEETETDGQGEATPTFQKVSVDYIGEFICPDYFKNALLTARMHDFLEVKDGMLTAFEPYSIEVDSTPEDNGALSVAVVTFRRLILTKTGCTDDSIQTQSVNVW